MFANMAAGAAIFGVIGSFAPVRIRGCRRAGTVIRPYIRALLQTIKQADGKM
jgi:hypothetical protein